MIMRWKQYLVFLLLSYAAIGIFFLLQVLFFFNEFSIRFLVVPAIIATVTGVLAGRMFELHQDLQKKNFLLHAVADFGLEFTFFLNHLGKLEYISQSVQDVTGYAPSEFYKRSSLLDDIIHDDDRQRWKEHMHDINSRSVGPESEYRIITKDGQVRWMLHLCSPVLDDQENFLGNRSSNLDITMRKEYELKIETMAYFDPLTNLPNRRLLLKHLSKSIRSLQETDQKFAVLFVDLERFNYVNDTYGHTFGDRILKEASSRFIAFCRECYHSKYGEVLHFFEKDRDFFISRFGGDEFIIVLAPVESTKEIIHFVQKVLDVLDVPFDLDGQTVHISGNIGISVFPQDGQSAEMLIKNADSAMYRAKSHSGRNYCFYSEQFSDQAMKTLHLENRLNEALKNDEFYLEYQPKMQIQDNALTGVEALLRWQQRDGKLINPSDFLPMAEQLGFIHEIGDVVLEKACAQWKQWHEQGFDIHISVNISPVQFLDDNFLERVRYILGQSGVNPSFLEFEITESALFQDNNDGIHKLEQIRDMGITISIDDFGKGYSSLNYLKALPIDVLKIDISFVQNIERGERDLAIIKTILSLSDNLSLKTVAEGVEDLAQHDILRQLGCQIGQGFFYSRPLPPEEIAKIIQKIV